jgi:hypothetical protein
MSDWGREYELIMLLELNILLMFAHNAFRDILQVKPYTKISEYHHSCKVQECR